MFDYCFCRRHNIETALGQYIVFSGAYVIHTQQARGIGPMLGWCWPIVYDAGPTSALHWASASCLLDLSTGQHVIILNYKLNQSVNSESWSAAGADKDWKHYNMGLQRNGMRDIHNTSSPWIWKGVSATSQSGRYTLSYPRGRHMYIFQVTFRAHVQRECWHVAHTRIFTHVLHTSQQILLTEQVKVKSMYIS